MRSASLVCVISTLAFSSFPGTGIALPSRLCWIWAWGLLAAWRCCVTWHRKEYIVIDFQAACVSDLENELFFVASLRTVNLLWISLWFSRKASCRAHVGASWLGNCPLALSWPLSLSMSPLGPSVPEVPAPAPVHALGPGRTPAGLLPEPDSLSQPPASCLSPVLTDRGKLTHKLSDLRAEV